MISIYRNTAFVLLLFAFFSSAGQKKFDLETKSISFELAGKDLAGYQTNFDFSRSEVRKAWWKYSRKFGNPLNMRTYYQLTVPSSLNDGDLDLLIYTQTADTNGQALFKIGIEDTQYKEQIQDMLFEFKRELYIHHYLVEMKLKEIEAERLSNSYLNAHSAGKKEAILKSLQANGAALEAIKKRIKEIAG